MDHIFTLPSNDLYWCQRVLVTGMGLLYPEARYSPVGLHATENIQEACPERLKTCSPDTTSKTATNVESPQTASSFPPGENLTARMGFTRPVGALVPLSYKQAAKRITVERMVNLCCGVVEDIDASVLVARSDEVSIR